MSVLTQIFEAGQELGLGTELLLSLIAYAISYILIGTKISFLFQTSATEQATDTSETIEWWEKVGIFLLYFLAFLAIVITALLALSLVPAAFFATGVWIAVLTIISAALTLIASLWWLIGFLLKPGELWDWYGKHKWWAFIIFGLLLVALLAIALILLKVALVTALIILAVALLWWLGVLFACYWLTLWEKQLKRFTDWVWDTYYALVTYLDKQIKRITVWERKTVKVYETHMVKTCGKYHWILKWLCVGWQVAKIGIVKLITFLVKRIIEIVILVAFVVTVIIHVLVFVVWVVTVFLPKFVFLCYFF